MIHIVDYNAGNVTSVQRALAYLGLKSIITADTAAIQSAERIIFPGVGHAAAAMRTLKERGLDVALRNAFAQGTPLMGICLGSQIVLTHSEEGDTPCIDLIDGRAKKFVMDDKSLKIPHMGWNSLLIRQPHPVLQSYSAGREVYFVHSYYPQPASEMAVYAACSYGGLFPAAIGYKNLFATQFHPEKSGPEGLAMLQNFAAWDGTLC